MSRFCVASFLVFPLKKHYFLTLRTDFVPFPEKSVDCVGSVRCRRRRGRRFVRAAGGGGLGRSPPGLQTQCTSAAKVLKRPIWVLFCWCCCFCCCCCCRCRCWLKGGSWGGGGTPNVSNSMPGGRKATASDTSVRRLRPGARHPKRGEGRGF